MTRTDLYESASEKFIQLDKKLRDAIDVREQHALRLEIISVLDVFSYILTKMKYLD